MISPQMTIRNMRSSRRVIFTLLALVAFSGSAWATCIGDDASEAQQMACCSAGHDQCPMHEAASPCCTTPVPQVQTQAPLVKAASPVTPLLRIVSFVVEPAVLMSSASRRLSPDSSPPSAALHAPPFIAFSALLI